MVTICNSWEYVIQSGTIILITGSGRQRSYWFPPASARLPQSLELALAEVFSAIQATTTELTDLVIKDKYVKSLNVVSERTVSLAVLTGDATTCVFS